MPAGTGDDAEAVALLDEVVRERPAEASYALLRADILLGLGRAGEAAAALDLLRRLGSLDGDGHVLLATLHLRGGREQLADAAVDAAFGGDAKPSVARALAAMREAVDRKAWEIARQLGTRIGAVLTAEQQAERRGWERLGARILIEADEDAAAGAAKLGTLLAEDPLDGESLLVLGKLRAREDRREEAELLLQRATRSDDFAHEAWIEIARVRVDQRRYPEALEAIDEALVLRQSTELASYREALAGLAEAAR